MDINDLIQFINLSNQDVFIEAEAKPERINNFISHYNSTYGQSINTNTDGIIRLQSDANKWGLELRLYLHSTTGMPAAYLRKTSHNDNYRGEYRYRLNDNAIINELFANGYRIGVN